MHSHTGSTGLFKSGGLIALACLLPILALAAIYVFNIPVGTVALVAIVLLCPLSHLFLMRHGGHDHHGHSSSSPQELVSTHERQEVPE